MKSKPVSASNGKVATPEVPIQGHEGVKYLRTIRSTCYPDEKPIHVDVYDVLDAFKVESHPVAHMIKKLLCLGQRGKGDKLADLIGVHAALCRAIEQEKVARGGVS